MHKLNLIYSHFIRLILLILPDAPFTMRLRGFMYSFMMKTCGKNFQVSSSAILRGLEKISCGEDVYIGPNVYLIAREGIIIEAEVLIAMNCVVVDANHGKDYTTNSYRFNRGKQKIIHIKKGSWVSANSVITAGSIIEEGEIIKPCSVIREKRNIL